MVLHWELVVLPGTRFADRQLEFKHLLLWGLEISSVDLHWKCKQAQSLQIDGLDLNISRDAIHTPPCRFLFTPETFWQ